MPAVEVANGLPPTLTPRAVIWDSVSVASMLRSTSVLAQPAGAPSMETVAEPGLSILMTSVFGGDSAFPTLSVAQ